MFRACASATTFAKASVVKESFSGTRKALVFSFLNNHGLAPPLKLRRHAESPWLLILRL